MFTILTVFMNGEREHLVFLRRSAERVSGSEGDKLPTLDFRLWTFGFIINKETRYLLDNGFYFKIGHRPTLPHFTAVPSALAGLTSLFGMGRGGHRRYRHLNILIV